MSTTPTPPIQTAPIDPATGLFTSVWRRWFSLLYSQAGGPGATLIEDGDFASPGYMVKASDGVYTSRTLTGTDNQITVTNGSGVDGATTFALADTLIIPGAVQFNEEIQILTNDNNTVSIVTPTSPGGNVTLTLPATDGTFALTSQIVTDIAGMTDIGTALDLDADYFPVYDTSALGNKKVLGAYLVRANKNLLPQGDISNVEPHFFASLTSHTQTGVDTGVWLLPGIGIIQSCAARYSVQKTGASLTATNGSAINYMLQIDVTTLDNSVAATDYARINFVMPAETTRRIYGISTTLSFWIKTTITGVYCVSLRHWLADTSGTLVPTMVKEITVNAADTWELKTVTFEAGATALNPVGNQMDIVDNVYSIVSITLMAGSSRNDATAGVWFDSTISSGADLATSNQVNAVNSASNFIRLAGLKLEEGSVATPFIPSSREEIQELTDRYVQSTRRVAGASVTNNYPWKGQGAQIGATTVSAYVPFRRPFNTGTTVGNPTVTLYDSTGTVNQADWTDITGTVTQRASTAANIDAMGFDLQQTAALDYSASVSYVAYITTLPGVI